MNLILGEITENLKSFTGSGTLFLLLLVSLLYLFFSEKKHTRFSLVFFPIGVLLVFFCPLWLIYIKHSVDGEILYRIMWLIPSAAIIAYAFVKMIYSLPGKYRHLSFAVAVVILVLSGEYIYSNPQFTKAENEYHVPETVVKICDEIIVPGREVKACFPEEFVPYVRQYTSLVWLTFGRASYMPVFSEYSEIKEILGNDYVNTEELMKVLRETGTPYLIVSSGCKFSENPWKYNFCFVTNIDGYDIYLDNEAYIGLGE